MTLHLRQVSIGKAMRSCVRFILSLVAMAFAGGQVMAQLGPPMVGPPPCWPPPCIPIDGGVLMLITAGAALGGAKLIAARKAAK